MSASIEGLIERVRQEVRRGEIPVDRATYERLGKDPEEPILYAGSLAAPVVIFGRDLGKDEVKFGQPLIGAGGKRVREGLLRAWDQPVPLAKATRATLEGALQHAILTNTVPYKPPGNNAYPDAVKDRFRPFLLQLLTRHWRGHDIITLGNEAFRWFEPYGSQVEFRGLGRTDERFTAAFICRLPSAGNDSNRTVTKQVSVLPLPHPSPLNRRWREQFPSMLFQRLEAIRVSL